MNAVPFDTLKFARKLEASGMAPATAAGTAEALTEAMTGAELATKTDIAGTHTAIGNLRIELKGDIEALRTEVKSEIGALRTELKTELGTLRTELKGDNTGLRAELKSDIELLRRDLVIKLGSIAIVGVGILLAAMRYMPVHP
jgi:hypothetical protein